ncbi:MAG: YabP/YqfC family sporulation protein [Clostridioides sp.]|jgi:sporulation protein YqfC|nr:YabP/YqfC family sporulation protein [Clostridioides sp.]
MEISEELQVNQPTITIVGSDFLSVANYISVVEFEQDLIKIKTKVKTVKITGDKLRIKYINTDEIGIKGIILGVELID